MDTANKCHTWVNSERCPVAVSGEITANQYFASRVDQTLPKVGAEQLQARVTPKQLQARVTPKHTID